MRDEKEGGKRERKCLGARRVVWRDRGLRGIVHEEVAHMYVEKVHPRSASSRERQKRRRRRKAWPLLRGLKRQRNGGSPGQIQETGNRRASGQGTKSLACSSICFRLI